MRHYRYFHHDFTVVVLLFIYNDNNITLYSTHSFVKSCTVFQFTTRGQYIAGSRARQEKACVNVQNSRLGQCKSLCTCSLPAKLLYVCTFHFTCHSQYAVSMFRHNDDKPNCDKQLEKIEREYQEESNLAETDNEKVIARAISSACVFHTAVYNLCVCTEN